MMRSVEAGMTLGRMLTTMAILILVGFAAFSTLDEALRFADMTKNYLRSRHDTTPYLPHPFLTIAMRPNYTQIHPNYAGNNGGKWEFRTNSLGFRSQEFSVRKPAGTYRIVVLGGSAVIWGSDTAHTFSSQLMELLNRAAGGRPRYEVINAGVPSYTSTQELFLVATQVIYWNPDMVITYDGYNDMTFGVRPSWQPNWQGRNEDIMQVLLTPDWTPDRQVFIYHLLRSRLHPTPSPTDVYAPHIEAIRVYQANLQSLVAILKDRGVTPVLIYQPSLFLKAPRTLQEGTILSHLNPDFVAAMRTWLPKGIQAMKATACGEHVLWADFTRVFDGMTTFVFMDSAHQTDLGNRTIAERMRNLIMPALHSSSPDAARQEQAACTSN